MKKFFTSFLFSIFVSVLFCVCAYAQTTAPGFAKYHISLPIAELGNCATPLSCKAFCDDPQNHEVCIAFAKQKGFYKGDLYRQKRAIALPSAQKELNCNSLETCKQLCDKSENLDKCSAFAQKFSLKGGEIKNPESPAIVQKAQAVLGCNSYDSCKTFCSQEANKERCNAFAQSAGLNGGIVKETVIPPVSQKVPMPSTSNTHPQPILQDPQTYCKQTPGCNWTGTTCVCPASQNFFPSNAPSPAGIIDCVGPDGKHFQTTQQQCNTFNQAWGNSSGTSTQPGSPTGGSVNFSSLGAGTPQITCTGPDGKQFQATQAQCDYFNAQWGQWKNNPQQSSTTQPTGTQSSTGGSGSSYPQCSSPQDCCSKCGGTWTGSTCNNPTSCH